jgi:acyl carrier protein
MEGTREASTPVAEGPQETAQRVADLYARVLSLHEVGTEDDFFTLGGTSLTALDLLTSISREFAVDVSARTFYRATTVRELASEVDKALLEGPTTC